MRNQQKSELLPTLPSMLAVHNSLKIRAFELGLQDITYMHFHNTFEIGFCLSGEGVLLHVGEEYSFSAGDAQIIFPFVPHIHMASSTKSCKWLWASIDHEALFEHMGIINFSIINELIYKASKLGGIIKKESEPLLHETIAAFINKNSNEGFPDLLHMSHSFLNILITAADSVPEHNCKTLENHEKLHRIAPALKQIELDIESGESTSIERLGKKCAMSSTGFRNVFFELMGTTPKLYIQACRMRRAKQLLRENNMNILDIAYSVGYKNISGFNRAFLNIAGEKPSDYRKKHSK